MPSEVRFNRVGGRCNSSVLCHEMLQCQKQQRGKSSIYNSYPSSLRGVEGQVEGRVDFKLPYG